jgi:hypothetical protein
VLTGRAQGGTTQGKSVSRTVKNSPVKCVHLSRSADLEKGLHPGNSFSQTGSAKTVAKAAMPRSA